MLRKTVKYLQTLERTEAKKESEETPAVVELAAVEENEEEVGWRAGGETKLEEEGGDLDPGRFHQVGRRTRSDVESRQGSDHGEMDRHVDDGRS